MKQSSVFQFWIICVVVLQGCTGAETKKAEINFINYPTFTGCGGVVPLFYNGDGYPSARISYKDGTPFSPDEFCVWTFFAEDTAGNIQIDFSKNNQDNADGIVVYTWKDSNFTSHKIPQGNSRLIIDAQHFAVSFSSDFASQSNGFNFDVRVTEAGDAVTNKKAYFSAQTNGEFTYPRIIGQENYDGDKRVSVVLHGPTETPRKTREYSLRDLDTEKNFDLVDVYILESYQFAPHYKFVGRYSGQKSGVVANSEIITPFPVLYLFSSDRKGTGKGFTISWKVSGNGIENTGDFLLSS